MNAMKIVKTIWLLPIALILFSCAKEEDEEVKKPPIADLIINVVNEVDGEELIYNNLINEKGLLD